MIFQVRIYLLEASSPTLGMKFVMPSTLLNYFIRDTHTYTLVVVEIHDFLDRWVVTIYGYLAFFDNKVSTIHQGYHFENTVRMNPQLLSYCFTPQIPADPFDFISTYPDNENL